MLLAHVNRTPNASQHRLTTIALVAAIHLLAISALVVGLTPKIFIAPPKPDIQTTLVPPEHTNDLPKPLRPIKFVNPANPIPQPPRWTTGPQKQAVTIVDTGAPGGVSVPSDQFIAARAVTATHTIPPYPALAIRLQEEGSVLLKLSIDENGAVTAAQVERTSGHSELDDAAVAWVIAHWRYNPATRGGHPIASTADAKVTFHLADL